VAPLTKRKAYLFAALVLFAINILNFYDRTVPGALTEPLRKEFHLTDTQVGLLGSVFIWLYAIIGVPLGLIADRWSRKKLLAWGVVIWSSLTAMAAFATNYPMLMVSRLGVGIGEAACAPTATSWLGDLFRPDQRSRALSLFMLGVPIGSSLSYFFSGPIAQAYGWRAAMILAAAPALLLVPALLLLHEPPRGASETQEASPSQGTIWRVLRIPTFWWIVVSGALLNFNLYALATFLPAFFSRVHHVTLARSGIITGVVYLVGGVSGGSLAGYLGDFIVHRRKDGRMLIASAAALFSVPLACLGVMRPAGSYVVAGVFFSLTYGTLVMYYGPVYSSVQDFVAPKQRGTVMALYFMAMYMCGASFGPLITGNLSDRLAHRAAALAGSATLTETSRAIGLQQAMLIIPVLSVVLSLVLFAGSRTIAADIKLREAPAQELAVSSD
jgi:predicted MFS family arabinose efflux permease